MRCHENKSDMSGDIVHNSNSDICTRCSSVGSNQNDDQRPGEGKRSNTISNSAKDSKSQCSICSSDKPTSHPQPSMPLCNSQSHGPLHSNNNNSANSRKRKTAQKKVKRRQQLGKTTKNSQNRKLTDYFPIRRSSRKNKTDLKNEEKKLIDKRITEGIEEGMEVQNTEGKGRGVFATQCFQKGDYVVEYHGDLLQITDAKKREAEYAKNPATGCYMYYFQYLCKTYCVDATKETDRMGRLINHSKNGNCQTKLHEISGVPHLILVASRNIDKGEELLYDYGDRSKASIAAHPWLKY